MILQGTGRLGGAGPPAPGQGRGGPAISAAPGYCRASEQGDSTFVKSQPVRLGEASPALSWPRRPDTPAPARSRGFGKPCCPVLSQRQKPVPGLTPSPALPQVATALGAGGSPRTSVGHQHPLSQQEGALGKVGDPKCTPGCLSGRVSWPGMHCRVLAQDRV